MKADSSSSAPSWQAAVGRPARSWQTAAVCVLLALHACLAFRGVLGRSVTADETAHIAAGRAYWQFGDYRLQPENGNLPQRWAALGFLVGEANLEPDAFPQAWESSMVWLVAQQFLFESGHSTDYLLLLARTWMIFWGLATGLLVYFWSRALWGATGALFSLGLFSVSPTALAHSPLATSDMCAAFWLLAATAGIAQACSHPDLRNTFLAGLAVGAACIAKFSALLLVPVALFLMLAGLIRHGGNAICPAYVRRLGGTVLGIAGLAFATIWTAFGWRFDTAAPDLPLLRSPYLPWETILGRGGLSAAAIETWREWRLLPEAYLYGLAHVLYFAGERGAFLAGHYSVTGWWWFFPFAFLVKSTLGELLVTGLVAGAAAVAPFRVGAKERWRALLAKPALPLVVFIAVYGTAAVTSNLNIGHRHLLPVYIALFVCAGACVAPGRSRGTRVAAGLGLLFSAGESALRHPHHLAFFNIAAGGPANGWHLLVDSSLDWGQDVAAVGEWIRRNRRPGEAVYYSVFGTADPHYEAGPGNLLAPYFALGKARHWIELEPGLYCISATMLQDVYGPKPGLWTAELEKDYQALRAIARANLRNGTWSDEIPALGFHLDHPLWLLDRLRFARMCQYLRIRRPEAFINHTQFVFRLTAREIEIMVDRPFSELAALMEVATRN